MTPISVTSLRINSCRIRGGGSCSMLINKPISQSFSLSWASWTRQQPGSNPALEGNWRRGRHGVRLSKRAEGCVSKGLAEAHQTPTRSKGVGCVWGVIWVAEWVGEKTERETATERNADKVMVLKRLRMKPPLLTIAWELCVCVIRCTWEWKWGRQCVCKCERACLCMCICTARRSHGKFLPGAVVCFLSVKPYRGNIQNIFRQTPSWWWWTLEVTQSSGETMFTVPKILC